MSLFNCRLLLINVSITICLFRGMVPFLLFPSDYFSILSFKLLPLSCFFLPTTPVKSVLQMILRSHRDGNEGAIFSTDQRKERERGARERASKQTGKREEGRERREKIIIFVCSSSWRL